MSREYPLDHFGGSAIALTGHPTRVAILQTLWREPASNHGHVIGGNLILVYAGYLDREGARDIVMVVADGIRIIAIDGKPVPAQFAPQNITAIHNGPPPLPPVVPATGRPACVPVA